MVTSGTVTGVDLDTTMEPEFCEACIKAKAMHQPFLKENFTEYKAYGDKVVGDVWGPARVMSLGNKSYVFIIKDLYS